MDINAYLAAQDNYCEPLLRNITEHTVPGELQTVVDYAAALRRASGVALQAMQDQPTTSLEEYIARFERIQRAEAALLVAVVCEEYADFAGRVLSTGIRR